MNELITLEHNQQRVLTTAQLAECYETDTQKITQNFNNNKERYVPGKHFFLLQGEALQAFKGNIENFDVADNVGRLYLWTEKGAWLHAKSLNTDRAWSAYETLVDEYYRIKEAIPQLSQLSPELQMAAQLLQAMSKVELEQKQITQRQDTIEARLDNLDAINIQGTEQQRLNAIVRKFAYQTGVIHSVAWRRFREAYNTAYHTNIELLMSNFKKKHGFDKLTVPQYLSLSGKIEDALRVADKLLNEKEAV